MTKHTNTPGFYSSATNVMLDQPDLSTIIMLVLHEKRVTFLTNKHHDIYVVMATD